MFKFRFNIKQLLMLFVLIGLVGGLLSAVVGRSYRIPFSTLAVGENSNLILCGSSALVPVDLARKRFGKRRNFVSSNSSMFSGTPEQVLMLDDDNLLILRLNGMQSFYELNYFNVKKDRLDRHVALPNDVFGNRKVQLGPTLITLVDAIPTRTNSQTTPQEKKLTNVMLYATKSGKRVRFDPKSLPDGTAESVAASSDGKRLAIAFQGEENSVGIFNLAGAMLHEIKLKGDFLKFVPGKPLVLVANSSSVVAINYEDGSTLWERDLKNANPESLKVDSSGTRLLIKRRFKVNVLDVASGADVSELSPTPPGTPRAFAFVDQDRIAFAPMSSDQGLEIHDIETGRIQFIGRYYRLLSALIFACLFIVWSWGWGKLTTVPTSDEIQRDQAAGASPFDDEKVDATLDVENSPDIVTDVEVLVSTPAGNTARRVRIVSWMMIVGGIVAICWSTIPMFYFGESTMGVFVREIFFGRIVMAMFGLATGVLAASRGFGKSRNLMTAAASMQILNLINLDVINFGLGSVELVLLHRNQPEQPSG